jgi:hypothetical protein
VTVPDQGAIEVKYTRQTERDGVMRAYFGVEYGFMHIRLNGMDEVYGRPEDISLDTSTIGPAPTRSTWGPDLPLNGVALSFYSRDEVDYGQTRRDFRPELGGANGFTEITRADPPGGFVEGRFDGAGTVYVREGEQFIEGAHLTGEFRVPRTPDL